MRSKLLERRQTITKNKTMTENGPVHQAVEKVSEIAYNHGELQGQLYALVIEWKHDPEVPGFAVSQLDRILDEYE